MKEIVRILTTVGLWAPEKVFVIFKFDIRAGAHAEGVGAAIITPTDIQEVSGLNLDGGTEVLRFLVFLLISSK
jgi:hypothetical protein